MGWLKGVVGGVIGVDGWLTGVDGRTIGVEGWTKGLDGVEDSSGGVEGWEGGVDCRAEGVYDSMFRVKAWYVWLGSWGSSRSGI